MVYPHEQEYKQYEKKPLKPFTRPSVANHLWDDFDRYLEGRGIDPQFAVDNGWYPSLNAKDTYPRIVIPAKDPMGLGFWQARSMFDDSPRYQSPSGNKGGSVVLTANMSQPSDGMCVILEGAFDALAVSFHTGVNGLATMGNTPNALCFSFIKDLLKRNKVKKVVLIPDRDDLPFSIKLSKQITPLGIEVKRLLLMKYKDVCKYPVEERVQALKPIAAYTESLKDE